MLKRVIVGLCISMAFVSSSFAQSSDGAAVTPQHTQHLPSIKIAEPVLHVSDQAMNRFKDVFNNKEELAQWEKQRQKDNACLDSPTHDYLKGKCKVEHYEIASNADLAYAKKITKDYCDLCEANHNKGVGNQPCHCTAETCNTKQ